MLPMKMLCVRGPDAALGVVTPRYLSARDEVWVRGALGLADGYVGRSAVERQRGLGPQVRALARRHGANARVADGVTHVLGRSYATEVASPLPPAEVRVVVFEEAARHARLDREAAIRRAATRLGLSPAEVERALFADRPEERCVVAPPEAPEAAEVVEQYNLALVQGLLLRSEQVVVELREHVRAVVRFAKLAGLLCTCSLGEAGTRLEVSGPLAILRHTTKYGHALARFFPAVVSTAGYRLEARCALGDQLVTVAIDASARIARTHALPRDADSAIERALARDLRRLGGPWTLEREADVVPVGSRLFFPDFSLRHRSGGRVLVEVVGFHTEEYLRSKLEALRAASARALVVCVDESLACGDGELPGSVLRFRRRIDAAALLRAAEALVATEEPRPLSPAVRGGARRVC